jgi:predicted MFS family arabinose efflux permease
MSTTTASIRETPGRQEQLSTRIVFFIAGFGMAAWAPLVPFAKIRANIDDGLLGLLLLCLGVGSIVAMPLAGALAARLGCRLVIALSTGLICLTLPFLATVSAIPQLVACLLIFGAGVGCLDVSMNIQAVIVERASGQTMMSGFHGLFSLGGIAGAAGITLLLGAGVSPLMAVLCVIAGMAAALALSASHLLPYGSKTEGPTFALPHGPVLFIGVLCFILFLTEGALLDWSAVFLTSVRGMDASQAGFGYATFALAMTTGRLTGDRVVRRVGPIRIVIFGALCAAAGVALATLISSWQVALLGYALVGLGCSNIVPVLFSSVGRQTIMAENVAIPAITTLGYAGILVGPAAIGFVSHSTNLQTAFMILALMLLGVAASGRLLRV